MRVQVWHEGECFYLQCGAGMQRVAWVARVAAQRFGAGGCWSTPEKDVGRPREYVPGRIFSYPDEDEIDAEATLQSLAENLGQADQELAFVVELRDKPAPGLPSLAAFGSEDSVIPPKNSKAAVAYQVTKNSKGRTVRRTPAPTPPPHEGHVFSEVYSAIDVSDLTQGVDVMQISALRNVLSNHFAALVDIFIHYARTRTTAGAETPEAGVAINMRSMATFVRTCRLSSETCSFFEIQRASVRPSMLLPQEPHEEWSLSLYEADYNVSHFFEAIIRIAHLKNYGLKALCDQVNKMINTQVLPFATGDDEDRVRELVQRPSVLMILYHQRGGLRKFYTKRMKLEKMGGSRSISLSELIACMRQSDQLDDELTPSTVKECWLATLSFDAHPDTVTEDDASIEITLSELEEIFIRCVLQKSKVAEENLPQQTDMFIKKFLRINL